MYRIYIIDSDIDIKKERI